MGQISGLGSHTNTAPIHAIPPDSLGQSYPQENPHPRGIEMSPLGMPLSIRAVASMLGCSLWTVRQRHIPDGLPHFRSGPNGKLIFFRDQVVAWILHQQRKGGRP